MPSARKHLLWAGRHLDAAREIQALTDPSWAAVALLYSARDLAHAVFDADVTLKDPCRHPLNHTNVDPANPGTNVVIKRHYRAVEIPYMDLYSMSLAVRYRGQQLNASAIGELVEQWAAVGRWARKELVACGRASLPAWVPGAT